MTMRREYSPVFVALVGLFVSCLLVSNIVAVKLIGVGGLVVTASIIVFPVSYLFSDVMTEVYGYSTARRVVWLGFSCNLLVVLVIAAGGALPAAGFWKGQDAYQITLGSTPRLLVASFIAYLCGEFLNCFVLAKLKILTGGKYLWTRTVSSTVVGQAVDSIIFVTVAFSGIIPGDALLVSIATQWCLKSLYEIVATPFTYAVVGALKRYEGLDVFDTSTNFSPVAL